MNSGQDALERRNGLPSELRFLAEKYPRGIWSAGIDVGGTAQFWLARHEMFRRVGDALTQSISDYHEERQTAYAFADTFAPKLQVFLGELDGHHRIEDRHYFPIFIEAEKRLARGFEILDGDHHAIHEALERNAETANDFLRVLDGSDDDRRRMADRYAAENERLVAMLTRHLADEEDLIVPLILDRGESALFG